jgi:hypothetical protein
MYQSSYTGAEIDSILLNDTVGSIDYAGAPSLANLQAQMTVALGFINGKLYVWKNTVDSTYTLVLKVSDTVFHTTALTLVE